MVSQYRSIVCDGMSQRAPRVAANEARHRILAAARELLLDRPFAALTVGDVMARAGVARPVFYRHFEGLPQLAPELLPDSEDPLVDQVLRGAPEDLIGTMITGLVELYADNGRWLRALDAAAAAQPARVRAPTDGNPSGIPARQIRPRQRHPRQPPRRNRRACRALAAPSGEPAMTLAEERWVGADPYDGGVGKLLRRVVDRDELLDE